MIKKLPIGVSDFKKLIEENYYYVDKTLFIKELYDSSAEVILLPRPRRFGKTLNISMLRYFFEQSENSNAHLFTNTLISGQPEFQKLQGQFPVIFLTFKDCKTATWIGTYGKMIELIAQEYTRHFTTLAPHMDQIELKIYNSICDMTASEELFGGSLLRLSGLLYRAYKKQVIILIDEYDAAIHAGYMHGYYDKIVEFVRSLLTAALKDNSFIHKGVLTGILRTAKEGIFSGLNNLDVLSLIDPNFQDKFGFTQQEVEKLLSDYSLLRTLSDVQTWYNGYTFGSTLIYNPWSLLQFVDKKGELKPYWVNTSDNALVKKLIAQSGTQVKLELEQLINKSGFVEKEIVDAFVFSGIEHDERAIWSLLLFSGYVTYKKCELRTGRLWCELIIPNTEILVQYQTLIEEIFIHSLSKLKTNKLIEHLIAGDEEFFSDLLQEFVINSMSVNDITENESEKSYHLFMLGMMVIFADIYEVRSNRESGLGRYDITLFPKKPNYPGILFEFKKVSRKETLEQAAQRALDQIEEKKYAQELVSRGVKDIVSVGIAFAGKELLVLMHKNF